MRRLYVLVRTDFNNRTYSAVQAGHALAEYMLKYPEDWSNQTLVYLGVDDEIDLEIWVNRLREAGHRVVEFREPDIGDQLTAISVMGADRLLRRLPLLT